MSDITAGYLSGRLARTTPRQRMLGAVSILVVVGLLAWGADWLFYGRYFETTDDAYVSGDVVPVTSREVGTVLAVHADNTQSVKRGQLLVELDPLTAQIGMQAAEADLARTVRTVRALFAKADELRAQLAQARVQFERAQADYRRRVAASSDGSVSKEDLAHARDALTQAKAAIAASDSALAQILAQIQGTNVDDNPEVLAAEAKLRDAAVVLAHMRLVAPVSGVVAQRSAEAGQEVAPGTPLLAVVPLSDVWVDANFKEVQLQRMRIGQPVTLTADVYGSGVTYHGRVAGLGAGSGSAFALLPPQNATGNWIKIVQRVPVRIELDKNELKAHPLRVGLSIDASVDVHDESGPLMSDKVRPRVPEDTTSRTSIASANVIIAKILAANGGSAMTPASVP
ncbi:MAG: HlyD family efflux transporter periplasmic adaptor subunit [Rhizomicrobium sp.]